MKWSSMHPSLLIYLWSKEQHERERVFKILARQHRIFEVLAHQDRIFEVLASLPSDYE